MTSSETETRRLYAELSPEDRVKVVREVKVGSRRWTVTTTGAVVKTERRRHGLHHRRGADDKVFSDIIVLTRDDGELTTLAIDEFTRLARLSEAAVGAAS